MMIELDEETLLSTRDLLLFILTSIAGRGRIRLYFTKPLEALRCFACSKSFGPLPIRDRAGAAGVGQVMHRQRRLHPA